MSVDERSTRSLSGTTSVWSRPVESGSGTSTPVATVLPSSTLSRTSTTAAASSTHHLAQFTAHRQPQPQVSQNLPSAQILSTTIVAAAGTGKGGTLPDKSDQTSGMRDQTPRKFGNAAIPIVRPSPSLQATVGHIGDGRRRTVFGKQDLSETSAPAEVEQTAVLLRSLDITPPLTSPSVNSSTTTPLSRISNLEPPRLRIDPYGQYSLTTDHSFNRLSLFDPFSDSTDTPVTQSPITPDRYDLFDLTMALQGTAPFDVGQGDLLRYHGPQDSLSKIFPLQASHPQSFAPSFENAKPINQQVAVVAPEPTPGDPYDVLAVRAAPIYQALLQGHYLSNADAVSPAFNPNQGMPFDTYSKSQDRVAPNLSAPQHNSLSHTNDIQVGGFHAPPAYQRSPSPYWHYLPAVDSQSLPPLPPHASTNIIAGSRTDVVPTLKTMKQDDWVTSFAPNHSTTQADIKHAVHHPSPVGYALNASWSNGTAPWSGQQSSVNGQCSIDTKTATGYSEKTLSTMGAPHQVAPLFSNRSSDPAYSHQGSDGFEQPSLGSNVFHPTDGVALCSFNSSNNPGEGMKAYSSLKSPFPTSNADRVGSSMLSTFAPAFVSRLNPVGDGPAQPFAPSAMTIHLAQKHAPLAQPRFDVSRSDEDEAINFLQLLQPDAKPPYIVLVNRIVRKSDQQASIFIQQKLKNASTEERSRIVSAIVERGLDMMQGRFGNWCVQRCLEGPCTRENRMKIVKCMAGHVVELATNCYGTHVVQKALECDEDIRRLIVNELLENDPAFTLTSKHCSHVWAKVMELSWHDGPAPPIFRVVNQSLRGKWASLACHETGSLVVQTMFENMDEAEDKRIIVDEILDNLDEVVKNQWGAFVIQHIVEHGNAAVSRRASLLLINNMAAYGTHDIAVKSLLKILKEKNPLTQDAAVSKMCEPNIHSNRNKRPVIVDLALSPNGSQLIQAILPQANKEQRTRLYEAVKGHTVTLRGCKTGSRVIWLFDRMRAYYGY